MKRNLFVFASFMILLSGCSQDDSAVDSYPYFKFTDLDKFKLIKPEMVGSVVRYKNQFNVIREFGVGKCVIEKQAFGFASFWGSSNNVDYAYDTQKTEVNYFDGNGSIYFHVNFVTTPSERTGKSPYKYSKPVFHGSIDFSLYNYDCGDPYSLDCGNVSTVDGFLYTQPMDIEGKHYDNVKVFYSGNNSVVDSPYEGLYDRTVNKFYYSDNYGIIGYDEIDGTNWRRVN